MNAITQLFSSVAGPLPDTEYPGFIGHEIVHAQLQILPRKDNEPLDFQMTPIPTNGRLDIDVYAAEVASKALPAPPGDLEMRVLQLEDPSPWDVPVTQQCWVLLELDPLVPGWQFFDAGIVNKGDDPDSYDFGMHYVLPGSAPRPGRIPGDGCKVIYFSVGRREMDPKNHHYVSLLIEFLRGDGKRFQVIFDPDVPNLGGNRIP